MKYLKESYYFCDIKTRAFHSTVRHYAKASNGADNAKETPCY